MQKDARQVRTATYRDAPTIRSMMEVLGYKSTISFIINQLESSFKSQDHFVFVCEQDNEVAGFITVHCLPQLGLSGDLMIITCLRVNDAFKGTGIEQALEQHVISEGFKRKCDRLQVYCADWCTPEIRFYEQQGYRENPKCYSKLFIYGE